LLLDAIDAVWYGHLDRIASTAGIMPSMETTWRWLLVTAVAPVSWGATYWVTRHFLPQDAPLWGAALRALPAGLVLLLIVRSLPTGRWWWRSLVLGVLNFGGFFVLIYVAAQLLPTSTASSVMALAPVALATLAWPLLGERPTVRFALGAFLGVGGVALVVGLGTAGADPRGIAASLAALVLSSLGAILTTRWRDGTALVASTAWQLVAGGILLLTAATVFEGAPPSVGPEGIVAYAAVALIATAMAFVCWFAGLRHLPAGTVGIVGLLNPVTGVLLGVLLAGERLTWWQGVGICLVLTGIATVQKRSPTAVGRLVEAKRTG
jgi:probable blue pigment (indigoidine) exporter